MEIIGTIYKILPQMEVTFGDGTKKKKAGFVIICDGEKPKKVAFELLGEERIALLAGLNEGNIVKVYFLPVSYEGKDGKYYTSLRCTNVFPLVAATAPSSGSGTAPAASDGTWNPTDGTLLKDYSFDALPPGEELPFDNDLPFE